MAADRPSIKRPEVQLRPDEGVLSGRVRMTVCDLENR